MISHDSPESTHCVSPCSPPTNPIESWATSVQPGVPLSAPPPSTITNISGDIPVDISDAGNMANEVKADKRKAAAVEIFQYEGPEGPESRKKSTAAVGKDTQDYADALTANLMAVIALVADTPERVKSYAIVFTDPLSDKLEVYNLKNLEPIYLGWLVYETISFVHSQTFNESTLETHLRSAYPLDVGNVIKALAHMRDHHRPPANPPRSFSWVEPEIAYLTSAADTSINPYHYLMFPKRSKLTVAKPDGILGYHIQWVQMIVRQEVQESALHGEITNKITVMSEICDLNLYFPYFIQEYKSKQTIHAARAQLHGALAAAAYASQPWIGVDNLIVGLAADDMTVEVWIGWAEFSTQRQIPKKIELESMRPMLPAPADADAKVADAKNADAMDIDMDAEAVEAAKTTAMVNEKKRMLNHYTHKIGVYPIITLDGHTRLWETLLHVHMWGLGERKKKIEKELGKSIKQELLERDGRVARRIAERR